MYIAHSTSPQCCQTNCLPADNKATQLNKVSSSKPLQEINEKRKRKSGATSFSLHISTLDSLHQQCLTQNEKSKCSRSSVQPIPTHVLVFPSLALSICLCLSLFLAIFLSLMPRVWNEIVRWCISLTQRM